MANKTPLASWLYSNRDSLGTLFKEFNWPRQYLPEVFDFSTKIVSDGIEAEGRGVDSIREIALEKSASEAIERLICKKLKFDSVGFAVTGSFDPSAHARFEALERFFLEHQIKNQISFSFIEEANPFAARFRLINPQAKVSFYRMATALELYGVVCLIETENKKTKSIGFGLSKSPDLSLKRSIFEALPNFTWLEDKTKDETRSIQTIPWHVEESFLEKIVPLLQTRENLESKIEPIDSPILERIEVNYSQISALRDAPIQLARFVLASPGEIE